MFSADLITALGIYIVWYGMVWYGKCVCMYVRMYVRGICVHDVSLHIYMFTHT